MKLTSFLPAFTWFVVSVILLALPGKDLPHNDIFNIPFFDKYIHFTMFLMLTTLFCYAILKWPIEQNNKKLWFIRIAVLVIIYGVIMEFVQKFFVVGRSFDLVDIVFDTVGSLAGLIIINQYSKKIGPNRNRGRNQN